MLLKKKHETALRISSPMSLVPRIALPTELSFLKYVRFVTDGSMIQTFIYTSYFEKHNTLIAARSIY